MDVIGLLKSVDSSADQSCECVSCIASILQDGDGGLLRLVTCIDGQTFFGLAGFGAGGTLVLGPCDVLVDKLVFGILGLTGLLMRCKAFECFALVLAGDGGSIVLSCGSGLCIDIGQICSIFGESGV